MDKGPSKIYWRHGAGANGNCRLKKVNAPWQTTKLKSIRPMAEGLDGGGGGLEFSNH